MDLAKELDVPGAAPSCALWVLGARLARSEATLKKALADRAQFAELVTGEIHDLECNLEALSASLGMFASA